MRPNVEVMLYHEMCEKLFLCKGNMNEVHSPHWEIAIFKGFIRLVLLRKWLCRAPLLPSGFKGLFDIYTIFAWLQAHARNRGTVELFGPNPNNDLLVDVETSEEAVSCSSEIEECSPAVCKIKAVLYFMVSKIKCILVVWRQTWALNIVIGVSRILPAI